MIWQLQNTPMCLSPRNKNYVHVTIIQRSKFGSIQATTTTTTTTNNNNNNNNECVWRQTNSRARNNKND